MLKQAVISLFSSRRRIIGVGAVAAVVLLLALTVRYRFYGHFQGVYVLKGDNGTVVLKDDLVLGDEHRLILALPAEPVFRFLRGDVSHASTTTGLDAEWFRFDGSGFVRSKFPDGTVFLTCLSRFLDSGGKETKGIFVGGGLPYDLTSDGRETLNETGMAFYNGSKWFHVWCNANESISPWQNPTAVINPSAWKFLGSKVIRNTPEELVITSNHQVDLDGVPFRVERVALFRAGDRYLTLAIRFINVGRFASGYYYVYGDEPWVGNYGTSVGNIGWVRDRIIKHEGTVDPQQYGWGGYFDYGNDAIGEPHRFTGLANFIEWQAGKRPDLVYFSNRIGYYADEKEQLPLASANNRVMFLQWGPRLLNPGQSDTIILSVGMADTNPQTGFPVKPDTAVALQRLLPYLAQGS